MPSIKYKKNKAIRNVAVCKGQISHWGTEFLLVSWQPALMMNAEHSCPANKLVKSHSSSMPFFLLLVHCKENLGLDIPDVLSSNNTNGKDVPLFLGQFLLSLLYEGCPWSYTFCINQGWLTSRGKWSALGMHITNPYLTTESLWNHWDKIKHPKWSKGFQNSQQNDLVQLMKNVPDCWQWCEFIQSMKIHSTKGVQHGSFFVRRIIGFKIIKACFETSGLLLNWFIYFAFSPHKASTVFIPHCQCLEIACVDSQCTITVSLETKVLFIYLDFFQKDLDSKRSARGTKWRHL